MDSKSKKKFTVSEGRYNNVLSAKIFFKLIYYIAIIMPLPSKFKARIFSLGGVRFKNISKVFIGYNVWLDTAYPEMISIGKDVIIGTGTKLICHSGGTIYHKGLVENKVEKIVIEDGVLVGINSIIMPGVKISKGAIVAAGSVVIKDVKKYSLVAGNPAKVIKNLK